MPDDNRTQFEITLNDKISAMLQGMAQSMRDLQRSAGDAANSLTALAQLRQSTEPLPSRLRSTSQEIKALTGVMQGFASGLLAPFGTVAGVTGLAYSVYKLAESRAQLGLFAESTRLTLKDVVQFTRGMENLGIPTEQARQILGKLTGSIKDINTYQYGSKAYQELAKMGGGGYEAAEKLRAASGDMRKSIDIVLDLMEKAGPRARAHLESIFGPQEVLLKIRDEMTRVKSALTLTPEEAAEMLRGWNDLYYGFKDWWERNIAFAAVRSSKKMQEQIELLKKGDIKGAISTEFSGPAFTGPKPDLTKEPVTLWELIFGKSSVAGTEPVTTPSWGRGRGGRGPLMALPGLGLLGLFGGGAAAPASTDDEKMKKTQEDSNRVLKEIRDMMRGGTGGAGGGAGGGPIRFRPGVGGSQGGGYGEDSSPSPDGAVPSDILAQAKKAALTGGPGAVGAFMAAQGYPRSGNWCGQFAAAVIKAAGGKPPQNPAIASNWRNWGTPVDKPQAGDIAVRRGRTPTGATGSHVTIVEGVDPETGTFTGIGGNQRAGPRSKYRTRSFDFRRGAADEQRAVIDGQQSQQQNPLESGKAKLKVNFLNVPPGVKTTTEADGIFKETEVSRTPRRGTVADRFVFGE